MQEKWGQCECEFAYSLLHIQLDKFQLFMCRVNNEKGRRNHCFEGLSWGVCPLCDLRIKGGLMLLYRPAESYL